MFFRSGPEIIVLGPDWHNLPKDSEDAAYLPDPYMVQQYNGSLYIPDYVPSDTGINIYYVLNKQPLKNDVNDLESVLRQINAFDDIQNSEALRDATEDTLFQYNRLSDQMKFCVPDNALAILQETVQENLPDGLPRQIKIRWSSKDGTNLIEPFTFDIPSGGITVSAFLNDNYDKIAKHFAKEGYAPYASDKSIGYWAMPTTWRCFEDTWERDYPDNVPNMDLNLNEFSLFYFYSDKKIGEIEFTVSPLVCGTAADTVKLTCSEETAYNIGLDGPDSRAVVSTSPDDRMAWPNDWVKGGQDYYIHSSFFHLLGYDFSDMQLKFNGGELVKVTPRGGNMDYVAKVTAVHDWDAGKVTTPATATSEGIKTFTCKGCSETKTEVIPKLDPSSGGTPGADPTQQMGTDGTAFGPGASAEAAEAAILKLKSDSDPKGTVFNALQLKSTKITKKSIKLTWKKAKGATKYVLYANKCGKSNKYKKLKVLSKNSLTVKKVAGKKLKKGTYYKFLLVALDKNNKVVSTSKTVHAATTGGKVGNSKKVTTKAKKNKVTVKVKKTFSLKAKAVPASKKLKVKKHRAIKYETSNAKIATVNAKGVIKGVKKGTCYVYAYAQNGVCAKIKVTVK